MGSGFHTLISSAADALYYLDLDPSHQAGKSSITSPSFGRAFRIATVPSDAEATGPAFNSDMTTILSGLPLLGLTGRERIFFYLVVNFFSMVVVVAQRIINLG